VDFKELNYILTIAEEGGFSRASRKLFLSQPSLSQYVKRLEDELGFGLFDRTQTPIALTDEGEHYVAYARKILMLREEMRRGFDDISSAKRGRVALGIPSIRGSVLLPDLIPYFKSQCPNIHISLLETPPGGSKILEASILDGKNDLIILGHPVSTRGIEFEPIYDERMFLAVPPPYEKDLKFLESKNTLYPLVDMSCLRDHPFIMGREYTLVRRMTESLCEPYGFRPNVVIETDSLVTTQRMVSLGYGLTLVPEMFLNSNYENFRPKHYSIQDPDYIWQMFIAYKKGGYLSKAAKVFLEVTKNYFKELTANRKARETVVE
jgi:DNA-binding transcriptional LysR family regulator